MEYDWVKQAGGELSSLASFSTGALINGAVGKTNGGMYATGSQTACLDPDLSIHWLS